MIKREDTVSSHKNNNDKNERIPYPLTKTTMTKPEDTVSSHKYRDDKTRGYRILSQIQR
jgi:hypothetical protein